SPSGAVGSPNVRGPGENAGPPPASSFTQANDAGFLDRAARGKPSRRFGVATGFFQALRRVVADVRRRLVERRRPLAYCGPPPRVHAEVPGTVSRGEGRRGAALGPAEGPALAQAVEQGLGQDDVAPEVRVLGIVEQPVVGDAPRAESAEDGRAVDQDDVM